MSESEAAAGQPSQQDDEEDAEQPKHRPSADTDGSASMDVEEDSDSGSDAYCDAGRRRGSSVRKSSVRKRSKRPEWTRKEEETLAELHCGVGNQWSIIAARLPGRTPNEVKNIWHSTLRSKHLKARSLLRAYATSLNGRWDDETARQEAYKVAISLSDQGAGEAAGANTKPARDGHTLSDASACTKDVQQQQPEQQQHLEQCVTPTYGTQLSGGSLLAASLNPITAGPPTAPVATSSARAPAKASTTDIDGRGGGSQRPKRQQGSNKRARTTFSPPISDCKRGDVSCVITVATSTAKDPSTGGVKDGLPGTFAPTQVAPSRMAGAVAPELPTQRPWASGAPGNAASGGILSTPFDKGSSALAREGAKMTFLPGPVTTGIPGAAFPRLGLSAPAGRVCPEPFMDAVPTPFGTSQGLSSSRQQQHLNLSSDDNVELPQSQLQQQQQQMLRSSWSMVPMPSSEAVPPHMPHHQPANVPQAQQPHQLQHLWPPEAGRAELALLPLRKRSSFSTGFDAPELLGLDNPETWLGRMDDTDMMLLAQDDEDEGCAGGPDPLANLPPGPDAGSSTALRAVTTGAPGLLGGGIAVAPARVEPTAAAANGAAIVMGDGSQPLSLAGGGAGLVPAANVESGPASGAWSSNNPGSNAAQPTSAAGSQGAQASPEVAPNAGASGTDNAPPAGLPQPQLKMDSHGPDDMALVLGPVHLPMGEYNDSMAGGHCNACVVAGHDSQGRQLSSLGGDAVITPVYGAAGQQPVGGTSSAPHTGHGAAPGDAAFSDVGAPASVGGGMSNCSVGPLTAGGPDARACAGLGWMPGVPGQQHLSPAYSSAGGKVPVADSVPYDASRQQLAQQAQRQPQQPWQQGAQVLSREPGRLEALRSGVHTLNGCLPMIPVNPLPVPPPPQLRQQQAPPVPPHLLAPPVRAYRPFFPQQPQHAAKPCHYPPPPQQQHIFYGQAYHYAQQQQQQMAHHYRQQQLQQIRSQQQYQHFHSPQQQHSQGQQACQIKHELSTLPQQQSAGQHQPPPQHPRQHPYRHLQTKLLRQAAETLVPCANCVTDVVTMGLDAVLDPQLRWCLVDTA